MTFYRLWGGKVLDNEDHIARYFRDDVNYLVNVANDLGIDTSRVEKIAEEAEDAIRNNEEPSDEAKKLIAAIFIGDAEWNEPLEEWLPGLYQKMLEFADSKVHRKWTDIARENGDLSMLDFPAYSTPRSLDIEQDEKDFDFVTSGMIAASVLHLEWWAYVAKEMDMDYDRSLVDRTREESLAYFTEGKDMDQDIKNFQVSLFQNDVDWIDSVMSEYEFRSRLLGRVRKELENVAEELSTT